MNDQDDRFYFIAKDGGYIFHHDLYSLFKIAQRFSKVQKRSHIIIDNRRPEFTREIVRVTPDGKLELGDDILLEDKARILRKEGLIK